MKIIIYRESPLLRKPESMNGKFKISAFCIERRMEDSVLLCNAGSGALVLLEKEEYEKISKGSAITEEWEKQLVSQGFLVPLNENEFERVDEKRKQWKKDLKINDRITSYTILPTSRCNARCFYCYEKGIQQKNMSRETAEDVVAFIVRKCKGEKVHLGWFGGEPTLAHSTITFICQRLREENVEFHSGMISNGLLLDRDLIGIAKEKWNLKHIQITIDGTQPVYNATKNYKGACENPFEIVCTNVGHLLENGIRVSIRINLGLHNYDDISELIEELSDRFVEKKGLTIYVHEIDNYYTETEYLELMSRTAELNNLLTEKELQDRPVLPELRLHSCMADVEDSILINPDGELGKCEHFVFSKLHGSINKEEIDESMIEKWTELIQLKQCKSCPFYASCARLKWCNGGGFFCREGMIQSKIDQTRSVMLQEHKKWERYRTEFLEKSSFQLTSSYEKKLIDGQMSAVFLMDHGEENVIIPMNQTSEEILEILQQPCTIKNIVNKIEEKYDTSGFHVTDIVEEYLNSLLNEGICARTITKTKEELNS